MMQRPRHVAAHHLLLQPDHEGAQVQALAHPLLEVARAIELGLEPRGIAGCGGRGAALHALRDPSLRLARDALIVSPAIPGPGKSSLGSDTIPPAVIARAP